MHIFFGILGIAAGFFLIKYREAVGDMVGDPPWASKIGGIYNVIILLAIFIFFWSIATITGTTQILFSPLTSMFPKSAP